MSRDIDILMSEWNGIERGTDTWCREQARLLADQILDTVDIEGIRAYLMEMGHANIDRAAALAGQMISHLLKLKYYAYDSNLDVHHWKNEIDTFSDQFVAVLEDNKDLLTNYYNELCKKMWKNAKRNYARAAKKNLGLQDGLNRIPNECPYIPEDLMDLTVEELLCKLD